MLIIRDNPVFLVKDACLLYAITVPYAYFVPYAYGMYHTCTVLYHTHMVQFPVPYAYGYTICAILLLAIASYKM